MLTHFTLAQKLSTIPVDKGIRTYQYIDNALTGGPDTGKVGNIQNYFIEHLEGVGLKIPEDKIQCLASEKKFLGREMLFVSLLRSYLLLTVASNCATNKKGTGPLEKLCP